MSGGSYDYVSYKLTEQCKDHMYDPEMNDMIVDLAQVLHELEWWQSSDFSESDYRAELAKFKKKWFNGSRDERLTKYVEASIQGLRTELMQMIGGN